MDTNVLMSGIFFSGAPATLLSFAAEARFTTVLTPLILDEYSRTFQKLAKKLPRGQDPRDARMYLDLFVLRSLLVADIPLLRPFAAMRTTTSSSRAPHFAAGSS